MRRLICLQILLIASLTQAPVLAAGPAYDFRIVIDVSGSMKQTDPKNLRVPALKLLNGLIPSGSRAGVWTFGKYVDMTVKWGKVDDSWRKRADLGADQIHSNALLTNIESALKRARVGWDKADNKRKRILLLLTQGRRFEGSGEKRDFTKQGAGGKPGRAEKGGCRGAFHSPV
jgi:hypothetical protein